MLFHINSVSTAYLCPSRDYSSRTGSAPILTGSTKSIPTPASYAFASTYGFAALASTIGGYEYVFRRSDGHTSFAFETTIGCT
jgi:hypothetical protein